MAGKNSGNNVGRTVALNTIWVVVYGFSYLFDSFGVLSGGGAALMVFATFLLTLFLWSLGQ